MELLVSDVADLAQLSERQVYRAIQDGSLSVQRRVAKIPVIEGTAAIAWHRSRHHGRKWTAEVRDAALDLMTNGTTSLLGTSERSRLRARLRTMSTPAIAHAAGGLGGTWARYSLEEAGATLASHGRVGLTEEEMVALGLTPGKSRMTLMTTESLGWFGLQQPVFLDHWGTIGVIERSADDRYARRLLDTYLLGNARESVAADQAIQEIASAL